MRQELDLAKAEIRQEVAKSGQAAGMLGGAALAGWFVLFFLSAALWWALANVMDQGWAALIVAVIWAIIGAILYVVGRGRLRQVHPKPEQTAETLKEIPETLKPNRSQS
jgi:apolipoprotein N-acyltransferase